jgi:hypothetical protein
MPSAKPVNADARNYVDPPTASTAYVHLTTGKTAAKIRAGHDVRERGAGDNRNMAIQQTTRLCTLEAAVGKSEACPEDACPFWEPGGAALGGRCAWEQLGVAADSELSAWLLEIRRRLEAASSADEERAVRRAFHHLLNDSDE